MVGGRLIAATRISVRGLVATLRGEAAFREEVALAAFMLPAALWLGRGAAERALLIAVVLAVLAAELLNTAVEKAVDRIGPERHPLAGRAKDAGSAAVFVALVNAGVVWALVLGERLLAR
jgi:diacylglycerol kinase (ATP)